jgi:hypothetical protein
MLVAIGGHSKHVGKTSVSAALIQALPEAGWTAVKVSYPLGSGAELVAVEATNRAGAGDSARYLRAGARHSWWIQAPADGLARAVPVLKEIIAAAPNTLIESNSLIGVLPPDLYLLVLDPAVDDFKASARDFLDRVDAFLFAGAGPPNPAWPIAPELLASKPCFRLQRGTWMDPTLADWVRERLRRGRFGSGT